MPEYCQTIKRATTETIIGPAKMEYRLLFMYPNYTVEPVKKSSQQLINRNCANEALFINNYR